MRWYCGFKKETYPERPEGCMGNWSVDDPCRWIPEFLILDDPPPPPETPETKAKRDRLIKEWFDAEVRSRVVGHTVVVIGSRL